MALLQKSSYISLIVAELVHTCLVDYIRGYDFRRYRSNNKVERGGASGPGNEVMYLLLQTAK